MPVDNIIDDEIHVVAEQPTLVSFTKPLIKKGKLTVKPHFSEEIKALCVGCDKKIKIHGRVKYYQYGEGRVSEKNEYPAICVKCIKGFKQCVSCSRYYRPDELKFDNCANCIKEAPLNYIRNYSFRVENSLGMRHGTVSAETDKEGKPKDQIYYGVELELESETDDYGLNVLIVDSLIKGFAHLKKDSSIKHGFEIVSAPATIEEHNYMWDKFFEKLPLTCHPLKSCGMHVHASRNLMSDLQIGKILEFLHTKENREFIRLVAGRESNFQNDFEKPKAIKDCRAVGVDRHTALNLNNDQTIEFRIFWATRDKRIFLKNIEFCKAIIKFADWANNSIKDSISYRRFIEWVFQHRKDYEYLTLFFETPSFRRFMKECNVQINY